jgi:hypothetical protein
MRKFLEQINDIRRFIMSMGEFIKNQEIDECSKTIKLEECKSNKVYSLKNKTLVRFYSVTTGLILFIIIPWIIGWVTIFTKLF